ncbi:MAG TPA: ABC transporter permease subunit [Actinomycetota bacterium]|jgi:ABC-2 type transport system permease protein|nr:ABC transporter permease subunit [Actinomycetota bacterium]
MLRNVFTKTLWDARRSLLGWALAISAVAAMYAAFWPTVNTPEMQQALGNYPEGVLEALNYDDLTSPAGYLASSVYGLLIPLLVAVFAIGYGTRAVADDEEAGTLDLLLAHPVSRTRLALQRFAALAAALVLVGAVLWLAMLAIAGPAELAGVSAAEFAAATAQLVLFGACLGALALAIGAATGRKALALGGSAGVAVLAYLANGVFPQLEGLEWTREVSPWHWYLGGEPLKNGLQAGDALLLLAVTAVLVAVGTWRFNRRDVAV